MKFIITIPDSYTTERNYIFLVILKEFLGLDYIVQPDGKANVYISDMEHKKCLIIPDGLFAMPERLWLTRESLPKQPLEVWNPQTMGFRSPPVPVIYGVCNTQFDATNQLHNSKDLCIPIDIFGACFFMLTRYEELVKPDRDEHDRFPSKAMLCTQEGFAERPIVNEYIDILWECLQKLWPSITRKKREYRLCLSHDVDNILAVVEKPLKQVFKRIGGDMIVRRDPVLALHSIHAAWQGIAENDPCNTFDFIMDVSDRNGIISTFNFISDMGEHRYDQKYSIEHSWARHCIRNIVQRGHLIGFHPTYASYLNAEKTKTEFQRLKKAAEEEGAKQNEWGGRQHYLRWKAPDTWLHWEEAGLNYDSTAGFADIVGFRTGCCYEYPVFDLKSKIKLRLRERSLNVMDCVILDHDGSFMNESLETISHLNNICKKYNGDFALLWHNDNVISRQQIKSYTATISSLL